MFILYREVRQTERSRKNSNENEGMKHLVWMRNTIFLLLAILALQFWLGMTINLEVNIPVKHLGPLSSILYFGGHFIFVLLHIANGFFILVVAIVLLSLSFMNRHSSLKIVSVITLASVMGAIVNGILFLDSGQFFGWSIGMAMSAVSALISASIGLFLVGHLLGLEESKSSKIDPPGY